MCADSTARKSASFGGLLRISSTPGGMSPSATSRRPQPVSMSTTVEGTEALMVEATDQAFQHPSPKCVQLLDTRDVDGDVLGRSWLDRR